MGIEYKIPCRNLTPAALDRVLRQAPGFARIEPTCGHYEFRAFGNADFSRMPDAVAMIEPDGVYFLDNGGSREIASAVLAHVERAVTQAGESFVLHEL